MAYTKLLNELIDSSGLTIKEIAERCTAQGVKVTPAYISTLRNDTNNRTPSDEMSKALARACNAKYEDLLVIEAYLETAPKEILGTLEFIRQGALATSMGLLDNKITTQQKKQAEELIRQLPLSEFVIELSSDLIKQSISKGQGTMSLKVTNEFEDMRITQQLKQAIGLTVNDNGMSPKIKKSDKVNFEAKNYKDYSTGDILLFAEKDSEKSKKKGLIVRQAIFDKNNKNITMVAINTDYMTKSYSKDDILIMGKVTQVITEIK